MDRSRDIGGTCMIGSADVVPIAKAITEHPDGPFPRMIYPYSPAKQYVSNYLSNSLIRVVTWDVVIPVLDKLDFERVI